MSRESAMAAAAGNVMPTVTEAPKAPVETTTTEPQQLQSTPFSHLAKKEADLVRQRQEFKKDQETWSQERERLSEAKKAYEQFLEAKKTDPVAALKMLGFSETDIFNYMANQAPQELTPEQKAIKAAEEATEAKIKAFEEAQVKKEKEALAKRDQELIQGFRNEISASIQKNKDEYEYCAYYGKEAEDLAYEITLAVVRESKGQEIITAEDAIKEAEAYFEENDKKMNSLKKRQPKPTEPAPTQNAEPVRTRTVTPPVDQSEQPKPPITRSRTLSSGATSGVAAARQSVHETREQKRERLIAALRNGGL